MLGGTAPGEDRRGQGGSGAAEVAEEVGVAHVPLLAFENHGAVLLEGASVVAVLSLRLSVALGLLLVLLEGGALWIFSNSVCSYNFEPPAMVVIAAGPSCFGLCHGIVICGNKLIRRKLRGSMSSVGK